MSIFNKITEKLPTLIKSLSALSILIVLLVLAIPTMFFTVNPEEDAVVLRWGKYDRTLGPGAHFKLPNFPPFLTIEEVIKVPVRKIHKLELGFSTVDYDGSSSRYNKSFEDGAESIMLTGDLNVADVEWIVQFQISNAREFLFNVRHVPKNLEDISLSVMREVVGDRTVTEVLTTGRLDIEIEAMRHMQEILNSYKMGIKLVALKLQDVNPPKVVKPSFNEVNAAKQEAEQYTNEAWKEYNRIIPESKGKADQSIDEAKGYSEDVVNRALGDAKRFEEFYKAYKSAPDITRKRLYLEKMRSIFQKANRLIVIDPNLKSVVPLLKLQGKES